MRVLVTGSRDWSDGKTLYDALSLTYMDWKRSEPLGAEEFIVVHGAARGADTLAQAWVDSVGTQDAHIAAESYPADWNRFGRAAGPRRNQEMIDTGIDLVLAFPLDKSPGTRGCMKMAKKAGIPVEQFQPKLW